MGVARGAIRENNELIKPDYPGTKKPRRENAGASVTISDPVGPPTAVWHHICPPFRELCQADRRLPENPVSSLRLKVSRREIQRAVTVASFTF